MNEARYKAFISYSHRDERWAKWLQRSLERYRVPRRLVGSKAAHGPVPARLRPVFRDREDLSTASDLSSSIRGELADSEFLIVVCSSAAAKSRWVSEEIRHFRESGGSDRILALVVDGDPQAGVGSGGCFPEAMLESSDGTQREPLAADVRRYADGKHLALLKIVAGLLGVRLDELRRRDAQRRLRQRVLWGLVTVVLVSVLGWLLYTQAAARAAAQAQRANTEELLSYMLGDLQRLDPVAGVDNLAVQHGEYTGLSARLGLSGMDNETLLQRAMDWREEGQQANWEGRLDGAMEHFRSSHAAIIELHRRDGNTGKVLFELGQAEFYVGEVYLQLGEPETAKEHWVRYGALTRRLLNREPNNPKYVMELSYTLMNLGALEQEFPVPDTEKSLELLQAALQYNQMALVLNPENPEYLDSLPTQLAWLADIWVRKCSLGNALEVRQQAVDLRRELAEKNPEDIDYLKWLAYALTGLARVQQQIGLGEGAVESLEESVAIMRQLHRAEPANEEIEWEVLFRQARLASLLAALGETEQAAAIFQPMSARTIELGIESDNRDHRREVQARLIVLELAKVLLVEGDIAGSERLLNAMVEGLAELVRAKPEAGESISALSWASFQYWEQTGRQPPGVSGLVPDGFLPAPEQVESCTHANLAARLAVSADRHDVARQYIDYALSKGYFEPDFITFCKRYGLCELP